MTTSTNLGNARRVRLHEGAETTERRVLLLVVADLVQGLTPHLGKLREDWGDDGRMHQADATDGDGSILMEAPRCLRVEEDRYQA